MKWTPNLKRALLALIITLIISELFISQVAMRNSDAFKKVLSYVEENEIVRAKTGGITGYGIWLKGDLNSPKGKSNFTFNIKGEEKNIRVKVELNQTSSKSWEVQSFNLID